MRILHIIPSMHMGGAEKFALDLTNELAKDNSNEVYLCSIDKVGQNLILAKQVSRKVQLISLGKTTSYSIGVLFKIVKLIKTLKPDVVHTHLRALPYASLGIILNRVPTIHTIHNLAQKETTHPMQKLHQVLFDIFNITPVSISDLVLQSTKIRYGNNYDELIYNGVTELETTEEFDNVKKEVDSYRKAKDTLVFLNIGRISKQKNQRMFIEAICRLNNEGIKAVALVIGALDSEVEYAQECFDKAKYCDNIHFIGLKSNVGDYMHCSDALCLSSIYEGLPLVVLEAMSVGKPVLATPAGGIPDVVQNGINGYVSRGFETEDYIKVLKQYVLEPIEDTDRIKKLYKKNYSMEICMTKYHTLYKKVIKN